MTFSDINGAILRIYSSGWDLPWRKTLKISEIPFFFPAMHTVTVKLTILQENSIFITEKCFYTDVEFVLKIINHCLTFSYYELPVYYYRLGRTGQSVSIEGLRKNWKDHLKMLYTILEYQRNNILTEQVNHLITERIRNVCEWQYLSFLYLENPNDQIKKELISFDEKLKNKLGILQNKEIDYEERIKILRELIVKDIGQFTTRYNFSKENSITDNSYRLWELIHYIGKFIDVYSEFIIEGIENKKIENNMGINRENVRSFAAFILYGAVGTIYNDYIIKGENKTNSSEAFGIISELFQRPH